MRQCVIRLIKPRGIFPGEQVMVISWLIGALGGLFVVGLYLANLVIAIAVYYDALSLNLFSRKAEILEASNRSELKILSPGGWAFVCLFLSLPALAVYWAAHHSTLGKG
jgi:hypothetical protein